MNSTPSDPGLAETARKCAVADPELFLEKCRILEELLFEENSKYNLTAIYDSYDFKVRHIIDSLYAGFYFPELASENLFLADIGCGAGFPSLVLAAAYPGLSLTSVDSRKKKTDFVNLAAEKMGLKNITVINARARELNRREIYRDSFDIISARAVSDASTLLRECRSMLKTGGKLILYKTPELAEAELKELSEKDRKSFSWTMSESFTLPDASERIFLCGVKL